RKSIACCRPRNSASVFSVLRARPGTGSGLSVGDLSRAINSPMDTTTPAGRAFLQIQAAFAEMERNLIRQRVREGIAAARARGRTGGRPRIMTADKLRYATHLMADRSRSIPA